MTYDNVIDNLNEIISTLKARDPQGRIEQSNIKIEALTKAIDIIKNQNRYENSLKIACAKIISNTEFNKIPIIASILSPIIPEVQECLDRQKCFETDSTNNKEDDADIITDTTIEENIEPDVESFNIFTIKFCFIWYW